LCNGVLVPTVPKLRNGSQLHLGLAHAPVESGAHRV
jgi:hypothetical protein